MPTKLNRILINLTDEQLDALPAGQVNTQRVMLALAGESLNLPEGVTAAELFRPHERGTIMKTNNPRKAKKKSCKRKTT